MVRRLIRWADHRWVFPVAAAWLVVYFIGRGTIFLWPSSFWLDVRRVAVFDSIAGAEIIMEVDREIHRNFIADWSVNVRRWVGGHWTLICTARGTSDYRPEAALPDPLTLSWWTDGQCASMREGRYLVSTIWTIRGAGGLPNKTIQTASNVFTVLPEGCEGDCQSGPEGRFTE